MKLKSPSVAAVLPTALFFTAGWMLAGWNAGPAKEPQPGAEGARIPAGGSPSADKAGKPAGAGGQALSSVTGKFADLLKMDAEASRMKPGDWLSLWEDLAPLNRHYGLMEKWPEADPRGALRAALAAQSDISLSDQEQYDFYYLGSRALNELFSRDPAAAVEGMRDWRAACGEYPRLDCLHLLVTGTPAQKSALLGILRKDGRERVPIGQVADGLRVLDLLTHAGFSSRPDILGGVVYETAQTHPEAAVDWILKQRAGAGAAGGPQLLERALSGLMSIERLKPDLKTTEAMGRLLDAAPPNVVDEWASVYAEGRARFDPEGARLWAEAHVPEARLGQVLSRIRTLEKRATEK